ncbi:MAG: hypothetical protein J6W62_00190 [Spirochaetia bacterium]|nr:hypothetical protein [Spirochaetia bacterium]
MDKLKMSHEQTEKALKKCALMSLTPIEAPEIDIVPEYFSYKNRTVEVLKKQIDWAYSKVKNKTPDSPIGKVIISRRGIRDSLFKGTNIYKASLYPIIDTLIESSILIYQNIDDEGEQQFILSNKYSRAGKNAFVSIIIKVDNEGNKYYSHTILQEKNNRKAQGSSENQNIAQKLHPVVNNILQKILDVNLKSISSPTDSSPS